MLEMDVSVLQNLPTLGSSSLLPKAKIVWGPQAMTPVVTSLPQGSLPSVFARNESLTKPLKSSRRQDRFTLPLESLLALDKLAYSKLITSLQERWHVTVESTTSSTVKQFILTGEAQDVVAAKRSLIKAITKPITVTSRIPTGCKPAIIGFNGRNIRSISGQYNVRIHVEESPLPDSFDRVLDDTFTQVSIHGDSESIKLVQEEFDKIVRQETRIRTYTISIEKREIIPSISLAKWKSKSMGCKLLPNDAQIVVKGPMQDAIKVRDEIVQYLAKLEEEFHIEEISIPVKFQLLIDKRKIKEKFRVKVIIEPNSESVKFIGSQDAVQESIKFARDSSKQYIVESIDISRAHGGNLEHAKRLALLMVKYSVFQGKYDKNIQIVIPHPLALVDSNSVVINILGQESDRELMKTAKKDIISFVNQISPSECLLVDDLDASLFADKIEKILSDSAKNAKFVQLAKFWENNDSIFIALNPQDDENDFRPSNDEVQAILSKINTTLDPLRQMQNSLESKTFHMDANVQDHILSDNSVIWRLISEEVDAHDIKISLHKPSRDEIQIRGGDKEVHVVLQALTTISASYNKMFEESLNVSITVLPRFIGNGGSNLIKIKQRFGVNIDVPPHQVNDSKQKSIDITIRGNKYNVTRSLVFIRSEIKRWADIITKELPIPAKYRGAIIGKDGQNIIRLQDRYAVKISFPEKTNIVSINGPSRAVTSAFEELKALLYFEMDNNHTVTVKIPIEYLPRIIGKKGANINDIRMEFGVQTSFLQNTEKLAKTPHAVVEMQLTGTSQDVKDAAEKIELMLDNLKNYVTKELDIDPKYYKNIIGPNGDTLRDIISKAGGHSLELGRPVDVPSSRSSKKVITVKGPTSFVTKVSEAIAKLVEDLENTTTTKISIPSARHGTIIGPMGNTRRTLEQECNVQISIPKKAQNKDYIEVTGTPENITDAEKKILELLGDDGVDLEISVPAAIHEYVSGRDSLIRTLKLEKFITIRHGDKLKRARKLNSKSVKFPTDGIRGGGKEDGNVKVTFDELAMEEIDESDAIPWLLSYTPLDLDSLVGTDDILEEKEVQTSSEILEFAKQRIEERMELAKESNHVAYIWSAQPRKFNSIIGPLGSRIDKIREDTSTIIIIPQKSDEINDVIFVRGPRKNVEQAVEILVNILKN